MQQLTPQQLKLRSWPQFLSQGVKQQHSSSYTPLCRITASASVSAATVAVAAVAAVAAVVVAAEVAAEVVAAVAAAAGAAAVATSAAVAAAAATLVAGEAAAIASRWVPTPSANDTSDNYHDQVLGDAGYL
jgi:hypothetical protein